MMTISNVWKDEKQFKAFFHKCRQDFEATLSGSQTLSAEALCEMRSENGYKNKDTDQLFRGFVMARSRDWRMLNYGMGNDKVYREPELLPNKQFNYPIHRFTEFVWGDEKFVAPNRQTTGACAGYVLTYGDKWPVQINAGDYVLYDQTGGAGAEYVDIVTMLHFDHDRDGFVAGKKAASEFCQQIMESRSHIRTSLELKYADDTWPNSYLIRLMITHNDFLAEQERWS